MIIKFTMKSSISSKYARLMNFDGTNFAKATSVFMDDSDMMWKSLV